MESCSIILTGATTLGSMGGSLVERRLISNVAVNLL